MRLAPGSFTWLLAHEIRLSWRGFTDVFSRMSPAAALAAGIGVILAVHAIAWPVAHWLSPWGQSHGASHTTLVTLMACAFSWMIAQSLFSAARSLYARGDLDLLLGSPMPATRIIAAKAAGIAAGSFSSIAILTLPVANVGAIIDTPAWLGIYPALAGMALIATALGLGITIAIFHGAGPARARLWTQMTGAMLAGSFVLSAQIAAMLPSSIRTQLTDWLEGPWDTSPVPLVALLRLPLDTLHGNGSAAIQFSAIALIAFSAATAVLGQSFARMTLASAGSNPGGSATAAAGTHRFRTGLAQNMRWKEWRLLARDPGVFAQLSLQIIYTLPVTVVLLRNESLPSALALAPTIVVIAAQIAASLAWITVSGEDAPELIATAPVQTAAVERAKLDAVALPVLTILALPLGVLAFVSWQAAILTALIAAAAGASTALLNFWHPMPGNRRGMLRRHSQSKAIALVEHGLSLLWAVAIVLAMMGIVFVAVPIALVVGILAFVRRGNQARA